MGYGDIDFPDEGTIKGMSYKEYKLDPVDEKNLSEIEKNIKDKKIDSNNKEDIITYLEKLFMKLTEIKKNEYAYEGDSNLNINRYLEKIKRIISQIEKI